MELSFVAFPDTQSRLDAFGAAGPGDVIKSGWVPPDERDPAAVRANEVAHALIPGLRITGRSAHENDTQVFLWDCWEKALGRKYSGIHQITGSCVGAGGGNALFSLAAADVVKRKDRELAKIPFWLLPYGVSRMLAGLHDRGDGSWGKSFAQAVREYGHIPAEQEGLPKFADRDGLVWGREVELDWSQGRRIAKQWTDQARPFLVKSTAQCRSADDVRDAIKSYYPVTVASDWGGGMRCQVVDGVLLNSHQTTWHHQMSVQGWFDHQNLGELFYILNQWGHDAHGRCPTGAPPGGFWVRKKDMEYIVRQQEAFAFSAFDGFPAPEERLDFAAF